MVTANSLPPGILGHSFGSLLNALCVETVALLWIMANSFQVAYFKQFVLLCFVAKGPAQFHEISPQKHTTRLCEPLFSRGRILIGKGGY